MTDRTEFRTTRPWVGTIDGLPVIENRRLEAMDNLVVSDAGAPWDYLPRAPFQFQMHDQTGDPAKSTWAICATLADAVNEFARWALPPRQGYIATIIDESFRRVLCSMHTTITPDGHPSPVWADGGAWFGVKAVFAEMRRQQVCDDVSIAMWEVTAMRTAPGSGYTE